MARKRIRNKDLAEALDITENSVYRLRKTDEMPRLSPERLDGICAVLQCQPGDLLEWVPDGGSLLTWAAATPELPERVAYPDPVSDAAESETVPQEVLDSLTKYCDRILALAWEGHIQYGVGAVIYTEKRSGPEIAYIEKKLLSDPDSHRAIDNNNPEKSAVVLYYYDESYDTGNYSIFILTGPTSPPDCYTRITQ